MDTTKIIVDSLGWIGSISLITGYWLNSRGKMSAQSFTYQLLNLIGGILLIVNTVYYGAYPSSAVNVVWVFIGGFYLMKIKKEKKSESI